MALQNILSHAIVQKLGWTLIHFVWQAAVVALLLGILLAVLRKSSASIRYIVACAALGLMVLLPIVTIQLVPVSIPQPVACTEPPPETVIVTIQSTNEEIPSAGVSEYKELAQLENAGVVQNIPWKQRAIERLEPALPYLVAGWLLGVFGLSLWHLGGWARLQRLKKQMVKRVNISLQIKLNELSSILKVKQGVQLLESALVQVPTVVGWLRPIILLPASALTGLSMEQLEALLAHELAHIRRYDYLVNMLQIVVETLGFYHPAVWWVSHRIRVERENCCDDLAVSISGDRVRYAMALTSMEEIRAGRRELAVAVTGGNLFGRIRRLVGKDSTESSRTSWIPSVITILLIALIVIPTTLAISTQSKSQKSEQETEIAGNVEKNLSVGADILTSTPVDPICKRALLFDGVDDCLRVPASPTLKLKPPFTIEMWIKPDFTEGERIKASGEDFYGLSLLRKGKKLRDDRKGPTEGLALSMDLSSVTIVYFGDGKHIADKTSLLAGDGSALAAHPGWLHMSVSCTREEYIPVPVESLVIGEAIEPPFLPPFKGQIAEIRIWNRFFNRSAPSRYTETALTGSEPNLIACWDFEHAEGQIVYDISPNKNHAYMGTSPDTDSADPKWIDLEATPDQPDHKTTMQPNKLVEKAAKSRDSHLNALPTGWSLDYDDGFLPNRGRHWPVNMANDLSSLELQLKPYDLRKMISKGEKYEFRIFSLEGEQMGDIRVISKAKFRMPSSKIFKPGKYALKYRREWGQSGDNFRMECGEYLIDLSKPGMYDLIFSPKVGKTEITGSLDGCYAINFEKVGDGPYIRGYAYQYPGKQYTLDGLPPGKYRLSAVTMHGSPNVFVSQVEVAVEGEDDITVNIDPPRTGNCSLKGTIHGRHEMYKTPMPASSESEGRWFILIRKPGSGPIGRTDAYEALTMDSLYVIRSGSIVQQTQDNAQYHIEGVVPGQYTVTAIEHPWRGGLAITRQESKTLLLKDSEEAVLDFDLRASQIDKKTDASAGNDEGRIEGKIIDIDTDKGISGVQLAAVPNSSPESNERFACTTAEDGTFTITGLQSGEYLLQGDFPSVDVGVISGRTTNDVLIGIHQGQTVLPQKETPEEQQSNGQIMIGSRLIQMPADAMKEAFGLNENFSSRLLVRQGHEISGRLLTLTQKRKDTKLLQTPQMLLNNHSTGTIAIIKELFFIHHYEPIEDEPGKLAPQRQHLEVGWKFKIFAEILEDGERVHIKLAARRQKPDFETLQYRPGYDYQIPSPPEIFATDFIAKNGEPVVIGRLIRDGTAYCLIVTPTLILPERQPEPLLGKKLPEPDDIQNIDSFKPEGKRILVCFWDMNQRPSRNLISELAKRKKELVDKNIAVLLVDTSGIEPAKLKEWLGNNNIPFTCGSIKDDAKDVLIRWGVRAQPWLILTDQNRIVQAEGFSLEQFDEKLRESIGSNQVVLKLVDPNSQPVVGAQVGTYVDWSDIAENPPVWFLRYGRNHIAADVKSDEHGKVTLEADEIFGSGWTTGGIAPLTAIDEGHYLAGLREMSRKDLGKEVTLMLQPGCRIRGRLTAAAARKRKWSTKILTVYVHWYAHRPCQYSSKQGRFEFVLPPGKYQIQVYSDDPDKAVILPILIKPGQLDLDLTKYLDGTSKQPVVQADIMVDAEDSAGAVQKPRIVQVDLSVVEVPPGSEVDRETTIEIRNLLEGKITILDLPAVGDLFREASEATAPVKDKSASDKRITQQQFKTLFDLLVSRGFVKILTRPTLEVIEGQTAQIKDEQNVLEVTADGIKDHIIYLTVKADLTSQIAPANEGQKPIISTRSFANFVSISSGQSQIIGGMVEMPARPDADTKSSQTPVGELMCIVTANIIDPSDNDRQQEKARVDKEYDVIQLNHVGATEAAERVTKVLSQLLEKEFRPSILVQPLENTGQIIIFGKPDMREMVKKLITQLDIASGLFVTKVFQLKYADPDLIKERIESSYKYPATERQETVSVISFPATKQVAVIASPENLSRISEQITKWDVFQVFKPRIIELKNSDPVKMARLLTTLFAEESGEGVNIRDVIPGEDIAGPLSSHFTFEDVPETSKIIVMSNIPKAYDAVGQLILELDKQKMTTKNVKQVREWIARLVRKGRLGIPITIDEVEQAERQQEPNSHSTRIMFDTKILTVSDEFLKSVGLDPNSLEGTGWWSENLLSNHGFGEQAEPIALTFNEHAVDLLLKAVQSRKDYKLLTRQQILATEGKQMEIPVVSQACFIEVAYEPSKPSKAPTTKTGKLQFGTFIRLTPELMPDDKKIALDLEKKVRLLKNVDEDKYKKGNPEEIPPCAIHDTKFRVVISNGDTLPIVCQRIAEPVLLTKHEVSQQEALWRNFNSIIRLAFRNSSSIKKPDRLLILVKPTISSRGSADI